MGDREVPFDPEQPCDNCGRMGAFDFMGDFLCQDCFAESVESDDLDLGEEDE